MWLDACGNVVIAASGLMIWSSRGRKIYSGTAIEAGRYADIAAGLLQGLLYVKGRYDV